MGRNEFKIFLVRTLVCEAGAITDAPGNLTNPASDAERGYIQKVARMTLCGNR